MEAKGTRAYARRCIIGFAANQGFLYSLFYLGSNRSLEFGFYSLERAELLIMLLGFIGSLVVLTVLPSKPRQAFLARGLLWGYGVLALVGYLLTLPLLFGDGVSLILSGVLTGVPSGFLLCAWGRRLGRYPTTQSVPEVFIASAFAAVGCFIISFLPGWVMYAITACCPLVSVFCLRGVDIDESKPEEPAAEPSSDAVSLISWRVLIGTGVYGLAAGSLETLASEPGMASTPAFSFSLLLFVLFCLATLQLFGKDILPTRKDASSSKSPRGESDRGPLDGAYRMAMLLMVGGFLFLPVLDAVDFGGESIVLAGYLGVSVVLISMFLVMARLTNRDATAAFARGFLALFVGEVVGIAVGSLIGSLALPYIAGDAVAAFSGLVALYGFLFLFTEQDLRSMTRAVKDKDLFEQACAIIADRAALSNREREILPLALRGRTSERIASEFFISKNTVETHLRRIYQKCGVKNKQALIDLGERTIESLQ